MSEEKRFFSIIFDEGQTSCYTSSPHGYKVSHGPRPSDTFYCINALHPTKDLNPIKEWHNEHEPRRADLNVVCLRNFLIEIDSMPLEEQVDYVLNKLPVTAITFSGSKSYHFIISLDEPCTTLEEYKDIARRILKLVPKADRSCKNPSRLSRIPGAFRKDTGSVQKLMYLGQRIPKTELLAKLPVSEQARTRERSPEEKKAFVSPLVIEATYLPEEVMERLGMQSRNQFFYYLGQRLQDLDLPMQKRVQYVQTAYNNLKNTTDFELIEAMAAARVTEEQ